MQKKGIKIKGSPLLCQILFKFLLCFWRIMVPIWNGNFSLLHFFQPITWQPTSLRLNAVISLVKNMQKVKISITWASHGAPSWSFFDNKKFCLVSNRKRKFKWVYFYQFGLLLFQFENSIFQLNVLPNKDHLIAGIREGWVLEFLQIFGKNLQTLVR